VQNFRKERRRKIKEKMARCSVKTEQAMLNPWSEGEEESLHINPFTHKRQNQWQY
jgi:ribosomal protein L21E